MQWGQGLQLIEDHTKCDEVDPPTSLQVEAGEELDLLVRFSEDGVVLQFQVERPPKVDANLAANA